jgi:hypothetical protein
MSEVDVQGRAVVVRGFALLVGHSSVLTGRFAITPKLKNDGQELSAVD